MKTLDIWYIGSKESEATAALFTYLRKNHKNRFIRKIPDIWKKLKPCDWMFICDGWNVSMVEVKILKKKDRDDYQEMFVPLMEPLQVLTFEKCTRLGIRCIMLWYSIHTHLFYFVDYKQQCLS